jgi:parallel beta-helix repeat protein
VEGARMNRVVFALIAVLLLLSISSMTGLIRVVKAEVGTITINADGSISPSTAPIYTADNVTYTLTGNIINGSIEVERDGIVVDGQGYTVQGPGGGAGVNLEGTSNVTVRNMMIENFVNGIDLSFVPSYPTASTGNASVDNTLFGNNITNSNVGILLDLASDNTLSDNIVTASSLIGIELYECENNILSSNTVTNSGIGIVLSYSSSNTIYQNNFVNNTQQANIPEGINVWDNGSVGNYWSDYLTRYPNATQVDSSGVWNTPYVIDAYDIDNYPLTVVVVPEFPSFLILPLFMIAILLAVIIYKKKAIPYKRL